MTEIVDRKEAEAASGLAELGQQLVGQGEPDPHTRAASRADRAPRKAEVALEVSTASLHELKNHERKLIADALGRTGGKIYGPDGAAALLGLRPTTLSSKVHRMGLKKFVAAG